MTDPVTLIAAGAAVGGLAGKFAEKTWECGERWLRERFGTHAAEAQQQARANATQFVQELAIQVNLLEVRQAVNPEQILETEKHPQFSVLLQQSLLNASQTDNHEKHKLLAQLVAIRLASAPETTVSLASQLASDAIARSTPNQLQLMALRSFIEVGRPRDPLAISDYRSWLQIWLEPFGDFEFHEFDAQHLVAIGCASYDPMSIHELHGWLQIKGGTHCIGMPLDDLLEVNLLQTQWDIGLAGVRLTSVGSIVGSLALDQIMGVDHGLPTWDSQ